MIAFLVGLYAVVSRIEFENGNGYGTPEQLVFVPMLFLAPLPLVPVLVATGFLLGRLRTRVARDERGHALSDLAGTWFALGPVWALAVLAPGEPPAVESAWIYGVAFAAQVLVGTAALMMHDYLARDPQQVRAAVWAYRVDAVLAPVGLVLALQAVEEPSTLIAVVPLTWLLHVFSQERTERYTATLELHNAYRGTVMLLSDVVEAEDDYTAFHCRSVVELVAEVAEEMNIPKADRQELEFAALLHDVGKIAIPKEILNKPCQAHRRGVRADQDAHDRGPAAARPRRRPHGPRRQDRSLVPRALGRQGLPGRPGWGGNPARGPDRLLLRRVQRDDHGPPLPQGDAPRRRPGRDPRQRRLAVRREGGSGARAGRPQRRPLPAPRRGRSSNACRGRGDRSPGPAAHAGRARSRRGGARGRRTPAATGCFDVEPFDELWQRLGR